MELFVISFRVEPYNFRELNCSPSRSHYLSLLVLLFLCVRVWLSEGTQKVGGGGGGRGGCT